jgi:hypothetical protein
MQLADDHVSIARSVTKADRQSVNASKVTAWVKTAKAQTEQKLSALRPKNRPSPAVVTATLKP